MSIKYWAEDDRPREKLLSKGASSLSNAEILAIIINNGTREMSAVDVTKILLNKVDNSLVKLSKMTVKEILQLKVKGIGEAKAVSIVAAMELLNRKSKETGFTTIVKCSEDAADYLKPHLDNYLHEVFGVLYLNQANKIVAFEIVSEGGMTSTVVDPRIIFKKALLHGAVSIILTHNHPSGSLKPSNADVNLTNKIKNGGAHLDIKIIDHIIISSSGYFSFADEGMM